MPSLQVITKILTDETFYYLDRLIMEYLKFKQYGLLVLKSFACHVKDHLIEQGWCFALDSWLFAA